METFFVPVLSVHQETPTVKVFTFDTKGTAFRFLPGQWVDLFLDVEGGRRAGGYSITSCSLDHDSFELAIKSSDRHPVTRAMHERVRVGDRIEVSGGQGTLVYDPDCRYSSVVLVAGGIGITPLMSIVRTAIRTNADRPVTLVYSCSSPDECAFRAELDALAASNPLIRLELIFSSEPTGRLTPERLQALGLARDADIFLCGPPAMVDEVSRAFSALAIPREKIHYEKWW